MIKYSIKISNDHQSLTEHFEDSQLMMDSDNVKLQKQVQDLMGKFNAPVEDVRIKASMDY